MRNLRTGICAALLLSVGIASADRLIFTPMGKKTPFNAFKFDLLSIPSRDVAFGMLSFGLTTQLELELYGESFDSDRIHLAGSAAFNLIAPITDISPGISVGVQDFANNTQDGRNVYLATTYYFGNVGEHNQDVPTIFTLGFSSREQGFLFVNFALPFSKNFRVVGEHDTYRISAGLEVTPFDGAMLRFLFRQDEPMIGFSFARRF